MSLMMKPVVKMHCLGNGNLLTTQYDSCYICSMGKCRFITKFSGFLRSITPRTARKWLHDLDFILMGMNKKMLLSYIRKLSVCKLHIYFPLAALW